MSEDGNGPLKHYLEVRDLGSRGYEVVVSVVNEAEAAATVRGVTVTVSKDGRGQGSHRLIFPGRHEGEAIELGQFEIAEGHFHLAPETRAKELRFQVAIDWSHDGKVETSRISRRIATGKFERRQGA